MTHTIPPAPSFGLSEAEVVQIRAAAVNWQRLNLEPIPDLPVGALPETSHDSLALEQGRLAWDQNARFWVERDRFIFWNGKRWKPDEKARSFTYTRWFLRQKAALIKQWARSRAFTMDEKEAKKLVNWANATAKELTNRATVAAIRDMMKSNEGAAVVTADLDSHQMLLGTPSGVIDLKSGAHRAAIPVELITKSVAVDPAPPGTAPALWLNFLDRVMAGDQEMISFLQRMLGYALTGLVTEHKLAFLHGSGRNGKGVFLNTAMAILADYGRKAPNSLFLESRTQEHKTDLAGLIGSRLAMGSEIGHGAFWDEVSIKDLTGGDVLTARFMRGDYFDFFPEFFLMIAGNSKPALRDVGPSMRERMMLVPFTEMIPQHERDPKLAEKLQLEWPAILRWMIDGCLAWQQFGLAVPEKVLSASRDYIDAEDFIGQFLDQRCKTDFDDPRCGTPKDAFVGTYNAWRQGEGLRPVPKVQVVKDLELHHIYEKKMRIVAGNPLWCFAGVELLMQQPIMPSVPPPTPPQKT